MWPIALVEKPSWTSVMSTHRCPAPGGFQRGCGAALGGEPTWSTAALSFLARPHSRG
jgi:hypothetical protein